MAWYNLIAGDSVSDGATYWPITWSIEQQSAAAHARLAACLPLHLSVHFFVHASILTCSHGSRNIHPASRQSIISIGYWSNIVSSWDSEKRIRSAHITSDNKILIGIACSFCLRIQGTLLKSRPFLFCGPITVEQNWHLGQLPPFSCESVTS